LRGGDGDGETTVALEETELLVLGEDVGAEKSLLAAVVQEDESFAFAAVADFQGSQEHVDAVENIRT